MADPTVDPKQADLTPDPKLEAKTFTQDDVDRIVKDRLARETSKFSDYEDLKKKADTLEAEKKKREEEELTENERLKKQLEEKDGIITELNSHKEWRANWETKEAESIEKEMDGLTDEQKELVNSLPLEKRRIAVLQFKSSLGKKAPGDMKGDGKRKIDGVPTLEELDELKRTYGANSVKFREAYKVYRDNRPL